MNADRLLQCYERIADAPDAIARLRRFILDLAVRGILVPQDPKDEPASDLLKRIAEEKARLVKAGEIKREKPGESGNDCDLGIDLPAGWSAAFLSDIAVCLDYRRVPINSTERDARIEGKPQESLFPYYGATQQQGWIDDYLFDGEFVLLGEDGAPFHDPLRTKAYLISGKSWVNNHAHVFQGILTSPRFLVHYLNVFDYAGRVVGATRAKLNQAQAVTIPVALPPLAEQHRIVAKVDELMGLCDRLEAARASRETVRDRLTAAGLGRLNAPDPETFHADARFALDALPALTTRPDQIKRLRQTILNLAVRGALTAATEKAIAAPCSKAVVDCPKPYAVGQGWRWVRMDEIVHFAGGSQPPKSTFIYEPRAGYTRLVQIRDFKSDAHQTFVPTEKANRPFSEDDVMIGRYGPPVFQILRGLSGTYNVALMKAEPIVSDLANDFLFLLLQESRIHDEVVKESERTAGQTGVRLPLLNSFVVALPPLAEQHRIVAKVDTMMALCDRLEASLTATAATRRRLLDALLAEALAPAEGRELQAAE